ncbi:MAG: hypothetical protein M0Z46_02065 [Actinomycetota bacterium]|nr:hypothetical protein [Actinomycetota bacterium]
MQDDATAFLSHPGAPVGTTPRDPPTSLSEDLGRLQRYAKALLDGVALPEDVDEDWPGFFRLADAFVVDVGSSRLKALRAQASLFEGWGEDPLTEGDRAFLVRLLNETADAWGERAHGPRKTRTAR